MTTRKLSNLMSNPVVAAGMFTVSAAVISPFVAYWLPEKSQKQPPVVIIPQPIMPVGASLPPVTAQSFDSPISSQIVSSPINASEPSVPIKKETEGPRQINSNDTPIPADEELYRLRTLSHLTPTNTTVRLSEALLGTYGFAEVPTVDAEGRFNIKAIVLKQYSSGALNYPVCHNRLRQIPVRGIM